MKFSIKIDTVLQVLEKNVHEHIQELHEANVVWSEKVIKAIESLRDAIDRHGLKASDEELRQLFYRKPLDNRPQYSKFIGALKLAKESGQIITEMNENDYDSAFNDNWEWRVQSKISNAAYKH